MNDSFESRTQLPQPEAQATGNLVDSGEETEHKRSLLSKVIGGVVVAGAIGSLIFEQSPGNETIRATEGFKALERTGSEYAAGAVVGGITMAIEMGSSVLAAAGFHLENERLNKFLSRFQKTKPDQGGDTDAEHTAPSKVKEAAIDTGAALGFGSAIVIARKRFQEPERGLKRDMITATKASGAIAGVSGFIGYLVAGGVRHAENVGLKEPADLFVNYATDWKLWGTVFGGAWAASLIKDKVSQFRNGKKQQTTSEEDSQ